MDETTLYLRTLEDLQRLVALGADYSMLRASAMLRQLFLDGSSSLVHQANRPTGLSCGSLFAVGRIQPWF
jgi:hypothetical protein